MIIRNGIYSELSNLQIKIFEVRSEVPIEADEKRYLIWYDLDKNCPFDDFVRSNNSDGFYKYVKFEEISNAYSVRTYGIYKSYKFEIFRGEKEANDTISIATRDEKLKNIAELIEVNTSWYMKSIKLFELEKMWEERTLSPFNLPLPKNFKEYEEIAIR
jgi:hypothetical protein